MFPTKAVRDWRKEENAALVQRMDIRALRPSGEMRDRG